ncbi:MAG: glycerol-3-phosphate dehydrogenase/oxidase [Ilumatobacteraceae bacterium]|nr:glycerol-3-phosphate dehydrogenase/oxidase [Ilumatobacteraceae bacterium]
MASSSTSSSLASDARLDRATGLLRLASDTFDVLVIGGGITGSGVVLDAVTRGLSTALVERDDFASGTSSKSSKLIHGGLRYLQQGDIRLVYEALRERKRLRRNASHLVHVLPFMIPILSKDSVVSKKIARALGSAMWMYDLTGGWRIGKLHKRLNADEAFAHIPTMSRERFSSAYLYYDAEADDARLCIAVLRTAAQHGAVLANACTVVAIDTDVDGTKLITLVDKYTGDKIVARARTVVNASGVWADDVRELDEGTHPHTIRPAKGVHLTVPWDKVRNDIAVVIPVPGDKRSLFVIPWVSNGDGTYKYTYIGTTDTDFKGPVNDPQCTKDDIDYVLRALNAAVNTGVTESDVTAVWSGLRPLVQTSDGEAVKGRTADLSRRHRVTTSPNGVVTVTGGKLTTYREMSQDAVDAVMQLLGSRRRCSTQRLSLRGSARFSPTKNASDLVRHIESRYGTDANQIYALIESDPHLATVLIEGLPYVKAEAIFAVTHEMATTLDDVLSRRTRSRLFDRRATIAQAGEVAALIAPLLNWDETRVANETRAFIDDCAREDAAARVTEEEFINSTQ